jgi:hypothetical protein
VKSGVAARMPKRLIVSRKMEKILLNVINIAGYTVKTLTITEPDCLTPAMLTEVMIYPVYKLMYTVYT